MSTLATDSKDCALLAPRPNREESQQSFNDKTEYDNRPHLTSWPTAPNCIANVKEEVWPPGREFAANWLQFRASKVLVLPQRYLGPAHTYLLSGYCEKFTLLVHRLLPERGARHTVFGLSWAIPTAAGVAKN